VSTWHEEREQRIRFIESLKVGDKIAARQRGGWGPAAYLIMTIERFTPSHIVTNKLRFRKNDGGQVGGGSFSYLEPVTDKVLQVVADNDVLMWFSRMTTLRQKPPIEVLRAMKAVYDQMTETPT
jgi:hypothetical protein